MRIGPIWEINSLTLHPLLHEASSVTTKKLVLCAIFGCGTRSVHYKEISLARIPSVKTNQGEKVRKLSE